MTTRAIELRAEDFSSPARAARRLTEVFRQLTQQLNERTRRILVVRLTTKNPVGTTFPVTLPKLDFTLAGLTLCNCISNALSAGKPTPVSASCVSWSKRDDGLYQVDFINGLSVSTDYTFTFEAFSG